MATPLFEITPPPAETVAAMVAAIEQWRNVGKVIGPAFERALLDQAFAVDLAKAARRATQISGANRTLYELLDAFHLLGDTPPPADDPFTALVNAMAGGTDDDV